jgi:hypothetical protein
MKQKQNQLKNKIRKKRTVSMESGMTHALAQSVPKQSLRGIICGDISCIGTFTDKKSSKKKANSHDARAA